MILSPSPSLLARGSGEGRRTGMRRVADNSLTIRNQALSLDDLTGFSLVDAFSEENVPFSLIRPFKEEISLDVE
jgi:hypothetical protein